MITCVTSRKKHKAVPPVTPVEAHSYNTSWSAGMKLVPLQWAKILGYWLALTGCWEHLRLCRGCQHLTPGLVTVREEAGE